MTSFDQFSLLTNVLLFSLAAAVVWFSGHQLSRYADVVSIKTNIGHALLGVLLLGGVTSLPELAVTLTASVGNNTALAVNNILGGVAMQVAVLAVADVAIRERALTSVVPDPVVLLQGSLNIVVLSLAACAVIAGDVAVFGIGAWSWVILAACLLSIRLLMKADKRQPWIANIEEEEWREGGPDGRADKHPVYEMSLRRVMLRAAAAGLAILAGGFVVTRTAEVIAVQTGIGQSFAGAVLVALSTSLPEVSTVLSALRLGLFTMAISDILGTNLFDVALLFVVDAIADGPPALAAAGEFAGVAALLGILLTAILLTGLAERRNKTFLRLGVDSGAIIVSYVFGLAILYTLR